MQMLLSPVSLGIAATLCFSANIFYSSQLLRQNQALKLDYNSTLVRGIWLGLILQLGLMIPSLLLPAGINLNLLVLFLLVGWSALFSISVLSRRDANPLLALIVMVFNVLALGAHLYYGGGEPVVVSHLGIATHATLSIVAYTLYAILAVHAAITLVQNRYLRQLSRNWMANLLPSLEAAEKLMLRLTWLCFIWLSITLLSGWLVLHDWFAQHVVHKTVFTISAWSVTLTLIWRQRQLLVESLAQLILLSFVMLLLGVMGSKFVLEFLL